MKNLVLLSLVALVFISCNKLDEPEILGTYTSITEGCVPGGGLMYPCSRIIIRAAGGVADMVYGGDIISRTSYKIKGDIIKIEKSDQFGLELTFKKLEDGSLREVGDKSIWLKQKN